MNAQDIITLKNGDEIKAKVTEISGSEVKYKRFDNQNGPTVVIEKAKVFAINYENGTREVINTITSDTPTNKPEPTRVQETNAVSSESKLAKPNLGLFFNPSGFLISGPMVGAEFSAGFFDLEANIYFPQLGLLAMNIITEGKDHTTEGGMGFLIAPKFYMNRTHGGFYAGAFIGYWKINKVIFSNEPNDKNNGYLTPAGVVFGTNVGYKFVLPSGLYFRMGAYLGANVDINYYWYPDYQYYKVEDWSGDVTVFPCLDLTIGFKLLKVKR
jgi:hypothetical protein